MFKVTVATRSSPYPDQMVTAVTWIQSVSRSDGGSAPRDDLYSSECQRRPGHLVEPQRQIPSEDPVSLTAIGTRQWEPDPPHNLTLLQPRIKLLVPSGQRRTAHYFDTLFPFFNTVKLL